MTSKTFCALDPNALGPDLELSQSNTVVACTVNGDDNHRMARGTIGLGDDNGIGYFEAAFWIDPAVNGAPSSPAGLIYVGLASQISSLSKYVGEDTQSVGYAAGDGGLYTFATLLEACDATNFSTGLNPSIIGVKYDSATNDIFISLNGTVIATHNIGPGVVWFPALTVCGPAAYSVLGWVNSGQRAFQYPQDDSDGWYALGGTDAPIYLAAIDDGPYLSAATDAPASAIFPAAIVDADSFAITRTNGVWTWTTSSDGASFSQLTVRNEFGQYDASFLRADYRDAVVKIYVLDRDDELADATLVGTAVVDDVLASNESATTITLKDIMATLEKPVQQKIFPPFMDAGVANKPVPILLGACRTVDVGAELVDAVNRLYIFSDAPVTRVANIFDQGTPLDVNAAQYEPAVNNTGLILQTDPAGKLTGDISSIGGTPVETGNPDILGGDGQFAIWTGTAPANFTFAGGTGNSITKRGTAQGFDHDYYALVQTTTPWQPTQGKFGVALEYSTANLDPGRTYRISVEIKQAFGTPPTVINNGVYGLPFGLQVRTGIDSLAFSAISPNGQPFTPPQFQSGIFHFEYTVPAGIERSLYFIVSASDGGAGVGSGPADVVFGNITAELVGQYVVQPLTGINVAGYLDAIYSRGGLKQADWSRTDAEALDAATGYLVGVNITDALNVSDAARLICDTYCATIFTDAAGVLRIRRLVDPINATPVLSFDLSEVEYGVSVKADYAPGLTTSVYARLNCSPASDSDLVSDADAVPPKYRTQLKDIGQFVLTTAKSLRNEYAFASQAPTKKYFVDEPTQAQAEIDRIGEFYSTDRAYAPRFVTFTVFYRDDPPALFFGDVIELIYPRYGFDEGANVCVVSTVLSPHAQTLVVTAWG